MRTLQITCSGELNLNGFNSFNWRVVGSVTRHSFVLSKHLTNPTLRLARLALQAELLLSCWIGQRGGNSFFCKVSYSFEDTSYLQRWALIYYRRLRCSARCFVCLGLLLATRLLGRRVVCVNLSGLLELAVSLSADQPRIPRARRSFTLVKCLDASKLFSVCLQRSKQSDNSIQVKPTNQLCSVRRRRRR